MKTLFFKAGKLNVEKIESSSSPATNATAKPANKISPDTSKETSCINRTNPGFCTKSNRQCPAFIL
jgi:hypothetical protein